MNFPIIGQEAVVPEYGLGRISYISYKENKIGVIPHIAGYEMKFDIKNIKLVKIQMED